MRWFITKFNQIYILLNNVCKSFFVSNFRIENWSSYLALNSHVNNSSDVETSVSLFLALPSNKRSALQLWDYLTENNMVYFKKKCSRWVQKKKPKSLKIAEGQLKWEWKCDLKIASPYRYLMSIKVFIC